MPITDANRSLSNRRPATQRNFPVAAGVKIYEGALVVLDSSGWARPGRTATGDKFRGRAIFEVDNTGGANGAKDVEVEFDMAILARNSAAGDAIAITDIGSDCYIVDDNTVAKTDGTGTRSRACPIWQVTAEGVWILPDR